MKCWHCNNDNDFIWGGDHDGEEDSDYLIVSNFHCPTCHSWALVYYPNKEDQPAPDDESTPGKLPSAS
jgi:formate dehydrogenase maturation protein FdhE